MAYSLVTGATARLYVVPVVVALAPAESAAVLLADVGFIQFYETGRRNAASAISSPDFASALLTCFAASWAFILCALPFTL
ncbi:MAG: hypothetical protein DMG24_17240 [Acidobacteria bacterium]|nr:MAG: hypothetical protein DMG24_17240 [Acidobacteriota bacterium]